MRLALLGPAENDLGALIRAAVTAYRKLRADRVIYLGVDAQFDALVAAWAHRSACLEPLALRLRNKLDASPEELERELELERLRDRLRCFQTLVAPTARSIELMHDRVVLLCHDKSGLDEEDLLPVSIIVLGTGPRLIRHIGPRVFFSPGSPSRSGEGILLLEEVRRPIAVLATMYDADGVETSQERIDIAMVGMTAKVSVRGST